MLKFKVVPPKTGQDVEFGKSAEPRLKKINRADDPHEKIAEETIFKIGEAAAEELLDNMEERTTLPEVIEVAQGIAANSTYFETNFSRTSIFLQGVVNRAVKDIFSPDKEPPIPGLD